MIDRIKSYVNVEIKSENKEDIYSRLVEQYQDFLAKGYSEEKAYIETINSFNRKNNISKEIKYSKNIDNMLFFESKNDQYVNAKAFRNFNFFFLMALSLGILSFLLFYAITIATNKEGIGFSVQATFLGASLIVYLIGFNDFHYTQNHILNTYKDEMTYLKGFLFLKNSLIAIVCFVVSSLLITLPYLIYDNPLFEKSIISFGFYLDVLGIYIGIAIILSFFAVFIIDILFSSRIKKLDENYVAIFEKGKLFKYGILGLFLIINNLLNINNVEGLVIVYLSFIIYDLYKLIKDKNLIFTRIIKIITWINIFLIFANRNTQEISVIGLIVLSLLFIIIKNKSVSWEEHLIHFAAYFLLLIPMVLYVSFDFHYLIEPKEINLFCLINNVLIIIYALGNIIYDLRVRYQLVNKSES